MTRSGSFVTTANDEWAARVMEFLAERPPLPPTAVFEMTVRVPRQVEHNPLFERPPAGGWREFAAWCRRILGYSWRQATGELREMPEERWQLHGVTLFSVRGGFAMDFESRAVDR